MSTMQHFKWLWDRGQTTPSTDTDGHPISTYVNFGAMLCRASE